MSKNLLLVLILALPLSFCGCKKERRQSANEIILGEFASLTGQTASFGVSSHQGLILAVEQANAAGGVLGKNIRVETADDRSDANEAVTAVQKLINRDKAIAIIGEVASKRSLAAANVCQTARIPMLSPASTNPDVTVEKGKVKDWIFRICFTDDYQGKMDGKFAVEMGWKKVAVLTNSDEDYSKGLSKFFQEAYKSSGQVLTSESFRNSDRDFRAQLERIKQMSPDAVYVPAYYTEAKLILTQAREMGLTVPFFGGDGWDSAETLALEAAQGSYYSDHFTADDPRAEVQDFVKAYKAKWNTAPDAMAVLGYDAGRVMIDAIKRAGKAEPDAIRQALASTSNFPGPSGTVTIDDKHNARKPIVILKIEDHKAKLFKTYAPE